MAEQWKSILGYPNYEASSLGRIRRAVGGQGTRVGYILKPKPHKHGYDLYDLSQNNQISRLTGQRLVCLAFKGKPPTKRHDAAHWDGNPKNNRPRNLRWATRKQNMTDADRHGRRQRGEAHHRAKLSDAKVRRIKKARAQIKPIPYRVLAERYGVSSSNIFAAANGTQWGHVK